MKKKYYIKYSYHGGFDEFGLGYVFFVANEQITESWIEHAISYCRDDYLKNKGRSVVPEQFVVALDCIVPLEG